MSERPYIIGVDPGSVSGAYAVLDNELAVFALDDLPVVDKQVNAAAWAFALKQIGPERCVAVVERVGAMPLQGVSSTFNFGMGCGIIRGVLAALDIPTYYVAPSKWKLRFGLDKDKEKSRALASRLHPEAASKLSRKKDAGRAEALLIARYHVVSHKP